jgi:hypothetical protein
VALALVPLLVAGRASAQSAPDWTYEVGLRSTIMLSAMPLSRLGAGFADLPSGGKALPHASSLFVLWRMGQHTRLGIETLVGNADPDSDTGVLFQGVGLTSEYQTAGTWFAAVGAQAGAMIASATQSPDRSTVRTGAHYKESGYFAALQLGVGRRLGRYEGRLVGRPVWHFGAEGLDAFDGVYAGISVARLNH